MTNNHKNSLNLSSSAIVTNLPENNSSQQLALTIAQAADNRKAEDITLLNVLEVSYLTDVFVIATGFSTAQVRAISSEVQEKVESEWQRKPLRVQGESEASWVVLDYGEVIVHIMLPAEREYYNLEAFWGHAERIDFPASSEI